VRLRYTDGVATVYADMMVYQGSGKTLSPDFPWPP
jgi:hypothetical protein